LVCGPFDRAYGAITQEFVRALLEDREPLVNVFEALAMTLPGLIAHEPSLKGRERLKISQVTA
jgi:hypothetical protein|tara:strand:+ start:165 stop:353 length:189 start_codon:yes stop_codon:yes gene_type:complete